MQKKLSNEAIGLFLQKTEGKLTNADLLQLLGQEDRILTAENLQMLVQSTAKSVYLEHWIIDAHLQDTTVPPTFMFRDCNFDGSSLLLGSTCVMSRLRVLDLSERTCGK